MTERLPMDDARRTMQPRGKPRRQTPAAKRFGASDAACCVAIVALVAGSLVTALQPEGFASEAPITVASAFDTAPASTEPTLVAVGQPAANVSAPPELDTKPVGTLPQEQTVPVEAPALPGGATIIDVPAPEVPAGRIVITDPSDLRQSQRVAHLPDRDLIVRSDEGSLPRRLNGRRPMDVYAGRWSGRRGNRVAIVVGGIGISQTGTADAIDRLPGSVTLGFSPAGNSLKRWMEEARRDGHELLLQVPMQPFGAAGPDPRGHRLSLDASPTENASRLRRSLGRLTNYVGVMNYTGGAFQANTDALTPVMREVADRGLLYLDDGTSGQSMADVVARSTATPFASADVVLDIKRDKAAIMAELDRLEELARGTGRAIGVASAFPETVEAVAEWVAAAGARGIEVVPVSALANDPGRSR